MMTTTSGLSSCGHSSTIVFLFLGLSAQATAFPATAEVGLIAKEVQGVASSESAASKDPTIVTIPLSKQYVPVQMNNNTVTHKFSYFGHIYAGFPQQQAFTVVFDTGSGHLFVPSVACDQPHCLMHNRYDINKSETGRRLDHDGRIVSHSSFRDQVEIGYGTGEMSGNFVREFVCLRDHSGEPAGDEPDCVELRLITATDMSEKPFVQFQFDGVLGLGLESLALDPEYSFFGQMMKQKGLTESLFGVFISKTDAFPSEISFGGHDHRRVSSALHYAPVARPELGYWQIHIHRVYVGDESLELCESGECVAIVDTGSSLLGVAKSEYQNIHSKLARAVPADMGDRLDCRQFPGPEVRFDIGGFNITLGAEDYSRPAALRVEDTKKNTTEVFCRAIFLPTKLDEILEAPAFVFGEPILRRYYTTFDAGRLQVGFALAQQPDPMPESEEPVHIVIDAPTAEPLHPNVVVI